MIQEIDAGRILVEGCDEGDILDVYISSQGRSCVVAGEAVRERGMERPKIGITVQMRPMTGFEVVLLVVRIFAPETKCTERGQDGRERGRIENEVHEAFVVDDFELKDRSEVLQELRGVDRRI